MKQWINDIISHPKRIAIPILTHPGIEMIGKTVLDAVTDGKVHAEAILALNERYPSAASTVIMDLTVEAEAFGCVINFSMDEVPTVSHRLVSKKNHSITQGNVMAMKRFGKVCARQNAIHGDVSSASPSIHILSTNNMPNLENSGFFGKFFI